MHSALKIYEPPAEEAGAEYGVPSTISPSPRLAVSPSGWRAWLYAAAVDFFAFALVMAIATNALAQGYCTIDPATGKQVCYRWPEPRIVRIAHPDPPYVGFLTGAIVCIDGRGYVLSCAHELERQGAMAVVEFSDGERCRGQVIAIDRQNDCSLLTLETTRRLSGFVIGEREPAPNEPVQLVGFAHGRLYRVRHSYLDCHKYVANSAALSQSIQGESGGPVVFSAGHVVGVISAGDGVETYCCRLPAIRAMLDRLFPGRPAVIVPHGPNQAPGAPQPGTGYGVPSAPANVPPSTFAPLPPLKEPGAGSGEQGVAADQSPAVPPISETFAPPATPAPRWPSAPSPANEGPPWWRAIARTIAENAVPLVVGTTGAGAAGVAWWLGGRLLAWRRGRRSARQPTFQ